MERAGDPAEAGLDDAVDRAEVQEPSPYGPLLGREDHPAGHGAALGVGGIHGWWAWKHRRQLRRGVDAVSPATLRGAVNVTLWFVGLVVIAVAGRELIGGPRPLWFLVALVVMIPVARWWDRRSGNRVAAPD